MYLIVGLGNPGAEYARTRHNVGFSVVERLAQRWQAVWEFEKKFNARLARASRADFKVLLCEPQTYMNASGEAVAAVSEFYRIARAKLLVIVDDADLPLGTIRLRPGGSSGGHHGLESIEQHLGSLEYARLRIGIGRQTGGAGVSPAKAGQASGLPRQITSHVLGRFSSTESAVLDKVLSVASDQAATWLEAGIQKAMSQFNGVLNGLDEERKAQ